MLTTNQETYPQSQEKYPYTALQLLNLSRYSKSITALKNVMEKSD